MTVSPQLFFVCDLGELFFEFLGQQIFQGRSADLLQFVAYALHGFVDLDHACQIDGSSRDDHVHVGAIDGLFQIRDHGVAVTHGRQDRPGA